jgi:hypothetical protein
LPVLRPGAVVIVLDALLEIAAVELLNESSPLFEIENVGSVLKGGAECVVRPALKARAERVREELRIDEEKNKFEAAWVRVDDCCVPEESTASLASVEFENGSNSHLSENSTTVT